MLQDLGPLIFKKHELRPLLMLELSNSFFVTFELQDMNALRVSLIDAGNTFEDADKKLGDFFLVKGCVEVRRARIICGSGGESAGSPKLGVWSPQPGCQGVTGVAQELCALQGVERNKIEKLVSQTGSATTRVQVRESVAVQGIAIYLKYYLFLFLSCAKGIARRTQR
jgi:hypothetical protein